MSAVPTKQATDTKSVIEDESKKDSTKKTPKQSETTAPQTPNSIQLPVDKCMGRGQKSHQAQVYDDIIQGPAAGKLLLKPSQMTLAELIAIKGGKRFLYTGSKEQAKLMGDSLYAPAKTHNPTVTESRSPELLYFKLQVLTHLQHKKLSIVVRPYQVPSFSYIYIGLSEVDKGNIALYHDGSFSIELTPNLHESIKTMFTTKLASISTLSSLGVKSEIKETHNAVVRLKKEGQILAKCLYEKEHYGLDSGEITQTILRANGRITELLNTLSKAAYRIYFGLGTNVRVGKLEHHVKIVKEAFIGYVFDPLMPCYDQGYLESFGAGDQYPTYNNYLTLSKTIAASIKEAQKDMAETSLARIPKSPASVNLDDVLATPQKKLVQGSAPNSTMTSPAHSLAKLLKKMKVDRPGTGVVSSKQLRSFANAAKDSKAKVKRRLEFTDTTKLHDVQEEPSDDDPTVGTKRSKPAESLAKN